MFFKDIGICSRNLEELRDDGFFITGDLARRDNEGYIHIVGRNKDLITGVITFTPS